MWNEFMGYHEISDVDTDIEDADLPVGGVLEFIPYADKD